MLISSYWLDRTIELDGQLWEFVAMVVMLSFVGAGLYFLSWGIKMPFRVYEAGFTKPFELSSRWLMEREVLVPKVQIEQVIFQRIPIIHYRTADGRPKRFKVRYRHAAWPDVVLKALYQIVPDSFDPETVEEFRLDGRVPEDADADSVYIPPSLSSRRREELEWEAHVDGKEVEEVDWDQVMREKYHIPDHLMEDAEKVKRLRELGALNPDEETGLAVGRTRIPEMVLEDRGGLLIEQTYDELTAERRRHKREVGMETLLLLTAVSVLVIGLVTSMGGLVTAILLLFLFCFGVVLGLLYGHGWGRGVPASVYENGVEVVTATGGRRFLPWGFFWNVGGPISRSEFSKVSVEGRTVFHWRPSFSQIEGLTLRTGLRSVVVFEPDFPQFEQVWDLVVERLGRREYITAEFRDQSKLMFDRVQWVSILVMVVLSGLLAWQLAGGFEEGPGKGTVYSFLLLFAPITVFFVTLGLGVIPLKIVWDGLDLKPRFKWFTMAVVAMVLLYAGTGVLGWNEAWSPSGEVMASEDPGESSLMAGVYENQELEVWGPVVVHDGEELLLINCSLEFSPDPWGDYGIWVGPGGYLEMVNTTVRSAKFRIGYTFEVHGSAVIADCWLRDLASGTWEVDVDGGLEIHNGEAILFNTRIEGVDGPGVVISNSQVVLDRCRLARMTGPAIVIRDGSANITGCAISECMMGIQAVGSDVAVENTIFEFMDHGVVSRSSEMTLVGCTFAHISHESVLFRGTRPEIEDCEYHYLDDNYVNATKSEERPSWQWTTRWEVCSPIMLLVVIIIYSYVFRGVRQYCRTGKFYREPVQTDAETEEGVSGTRLVTSEEMDANRKFENGDLTVVECPKCNVYNEVTAPGRPFEFRCNSCGALLRLSK
jgi:hypothetical protein